MGPGRALVVGTFGVRNDAIPIADRQCERSLSPAPGRIRKKAPVADALSLQSDLPPVSADRWLIEPADGEFLFAVAHGAGLLFVDELLSQWNRKDIPAPGDVNLQEQHV